jgi:transcriptional regulator with XRE-family HTH domain
MMAFDKVEIGARIKQARLESGLTQEELAGMGSFSYRSIQGYETGERIPFKHFPELSQLLRKPTVWFLYGDEPDDSIEEIKTRFDELLARVKLIEYQQREILEALKLPPLESQ